MGLSISMSVTGEGHKAKFNKSARVSYSPSNDLARLAAARTESEVRSVIMRIRAELKQIKSSGADAKQIKDVCKRMESVIGKGNRKIKNLRNEQELKEQERVQRNTGKLKAAELTQEELITKRRRRKARERGEICDGSVRDVILERQREEYRENSIKESGSICTSTVSLSEPVAVPESIDVLT